MDVLYSIILLLPAFADVIRSVSLGRLKSLQFFPALIQGEGRERNTPRDEYTLSSPC